MVFVRWHYRDGVYVRSHYRRTRQPDAVGQATLFAPRVDTRTVSSVEVLSIGAPLDRVRHRL